jgi:hypothetical protein
MTLLEKYKQSLSEMVAGDSGGSPSNIASGTTTGDVVNKGPETLSQKKRKDKPSEE